MGLWSQVKESVVAVRESVFRQSTPDRVLSLNGDWNLRVVGDDYVPEHSQKVPVGVDFPVELRREPENRHDRHAIMVMHKGHKIGYISSSSATGYAPLIDIVNKNGETVHATATAQRDESRWVSAGVEMPSVYEFALLLGPDASRIAEANKPPIQATFKRLSKYQDQLGCILAGMEERQIRAKIVLDETPSGKYKGRNMVKFFYQGEEIGVLPAQYRDANEEFFGAAESGKTTCKVLIRRYDERLWARATMD